MSTARSNKYVQYVESVIPTKHQPEFVIRTCGDDHIGAGQRFGDGLRLRYRPHTANVERPRTSMSSAGASCDSTWWSISAIVRESLRSDPLKHSVSLTPQKAPESTVMSSAGRINNHYADDVTQ